MKIWEKFAGPWPVIIRVIKRTSLYRKSWVRCGLLILFKADASDKEMKFTRNYKRRKTKVWPYFE
jgi:hypothetical protein